MMKDFDVALCKMFAISIISVMNVDWFFAITSPLHTRAKRPSTAGITAFFAGT